MPTLFQLVLCRQLYYIFQTSLIRTSLNFKLNLGERENIHA